MMLNDDDVEIDMDLLEDLLNDDFDIFCSFDTICQTVPL